MMKKKRENVCQRYGDIVKKRELFHLYMDKQFHYGHIQKP